MNHKFETLKERYRNSWDNIKPIVLRPKGEILVKEDFGALSQRSYAKNSNLCSSVDLSRDVHNSRAVANCIRGLNDKTAELLKENAELKRLYDDLKSNYLNEKDEYLKIIDEKQRSQYFEENNVKEKLRELDEFSKNFQMKTALLTKELENSKQENSTKDTEISKLKTVLQTKDKEIIELKEERLQLKEKFSEEIEQASQMIKRLESDQKIQKADQKKLKEIYQEQQARDLEKEACKWQDNLKILENELKTCKDENAQLKSKLNELEDKKVSLIEQNNQSETFVKEIAEINEKLLAVVRGKNRKGQINTSNSRVTVSKQDFGERFSSFPTQRKQDSQIMEASILENELSQLNNRYKNLLKIGKEGREDMSVLGVELNSVAAALEAKTNHLHSLKSVISDKVN